MNTAMIYWVISASLTVMLVGVLRHLFGEHISRNMRYGLWLVVLLRLLIPISLGSSGLSIQNWLDVETETGALFVSASGSGSANASAETFAGIRGDSSGSALVDGSENNSGSALVDATGNIPASTSADSSGSAAGNPSANTSAILSSEASAGTSAGTSVKEKMAEWGTVIAGIWGIGALAALLWIAAVNLFLYRKLRRSRRQIGEHEGLAVYVTPEIVSPCLFGVCPPAIYLTPTVEGIGDGVSYAVLHETCHYHHGDHLWSLVRGIVLAIWWWNPLVWWAAKASRQDSEMACDEACIKALGEDCRRNYGKVLIQSLQHTAPAAWRRSLGMAATMVSGKQELASRLQFLMKRPVVRSLAVVVVAVTVTLGVMVTFTGKNAQASELPPEIPFYLLEGALDQEGEQTRFVNGEINVYIETYPWTSYTFCFSDEEKEGGLETVTVYEEYAPGCSYYINESQHDLAYRQISRTKYEAAIQEILTGENRSGVRLHLCYEDGQIVKACLRSEEEVCCNAEEPLTWKNYLSSDITDGLEGYELDGYELAAQWTADLSDAEGMEEITIYVNPVESEEHGEAQDEVQEWILVRDAAGNDLYARAHRAGSALTDQYYLVQDATGTQYLLYMTTSIFETGAYADYRLFRLGADGNVLQKSGSTYGAVYDLAYNGHLCDSQQLTLLLEPLWEYTSNAQLLIRTGEGSVDYGPSASSGKSLHGELSRLQKELLSSYTDYIEKNIVSPCTEAK